MKKRGILSFIKRCVADTRYYAKHFDNPQVMIIMRKLLAELFWFYGMEDTKRQNQVRVTKHRLRFYLLYISKRRLMDKIIAKMTGAARLERHLIEYNNFALDIVTKRGNINQNYEAILVEFLYSEYC